MYANTRNHQSIPRIRPSGSDVVLDMSWFSANQTLTDCPSKSIHFTRPFAQLVYFSSLALEIAIPLQFILRLFRCFHNPMSLHPCFLDGLKCRAIFFNPCTVSPHGPPDLLGVLLSDRVLHIQKKTSSSPLIQDALQIVSSAFAICTLPSSLYLLFLLMWYKFQKFIRWVIPMPSAIRVNRKFSRVILFWYFTGKIFKLKAFF